MEADSTTYENTYHANTKVADSLPFTICPGNYKLYQDFIEDNVEKNIEYQIVERLQQFGLLPNTVKCPSSNPDCNVVCKVARVIDRVQWVCAGCGKRQPIRIGSFFFKLQCSILQVLQMTLAWCEDVDITVALQHFDVKPKVAISIYDRLDELAIKELNRQKLGGENSVVMAEMYPDCLNRLSPDTTDQPHVHRILMLADTKHISTYYRLHVIKGDPKNLHSDNMDDDEILKSEVEMVLSNMTEPGSMIVLGNNVPSIDGCVSYQNLVQHCDVDMQRFLSSRVWRQALTLCAASRDLCVAGTGAGVASGANVGVTGAGAGVGAAACALAVQRYLDASLYRLRYEDGFYDHILKLISAEFTETSASDAN
ncbi:PREDICTED: uncharacterized protein LOC106109200 [Papilio polytes]|uniref:uncharacterized protein LOC106109200 n=1 Tax=Papilio polytes TaxID=76194 RepID=UPI000676622E|nr:PREDICTED: uncharacterized protein LOC106109200 [Papilio polytes]